MNIATAGYEAIALVLAPRGRDSMIARDLLAQSRVTAKICRDLSEFVASLDDDVSFGLIAEEALRAGDPQPLLNCLQRQPGWSDLPLVILTHRGASAEPSPDAARLSTLLGNVTYVERPFHLRTFRSVATSAVKARQRQFDARARIEELRQSGMSLQTALQAGRLGAFEIDTERVALTASGSFKEKFGLAQDADLSHDAMLSCAHPDDRERLRAFCQLSVPPGNDRSLECRVMWPDGSEHWIDLHAREVAPTREHGHRIVGVASDITERKSAEHGLRRLNETLEEQVQERTRELLAMHEAVMAEVAQRERAEEKLRQAQKLELIGQLTGGVAHDFNNLLMAVLGNLQILSRRLKGDPAITRLIDGAVQGAKRGASLTQRLLAFARRQDLQVSAVELNGLVQGMSELLQRSIGSQIELQILRSPSPAVALIDENQIELALLNLVVNARDAMPDGGRVTIEIQPAADDAERADARMVRLIVSDTGKGMDADTLRKATEPFFTTKELGKGTGLGLSMIHGLAVQLKGSLSLSSEVGVGTRAELSLPATPLAPSTSPAMPASHDAPQVERPLKILVVDDDPLIAMSTVDMLEDLGHATICVNSGEHAMRLINGAEEFDLVITDYSMPRMNGAQLANHARGVRPGLPILLVSGFAELPDDQRLTLPRLGKPYQQEQLSREIAKIMATRH